jgi:uncharacterized membrane protein
MFGLSLAVAACGDDDEDSDLPEVDCSDGRPEYADVEVFDKCTTCHSSELEGDDRNDAPSDVNFDTESAAEDHAEEAAEEVYEGEMPPQDSGIKLTSEEKQTLYEWALCSD